MNAIEIDEALSELAAAPFDAEEFPYAFLEAFGNKPTTIQRLRDGSSNSSDIEGGVLQRSNIHIAVCSSGNVSETLAKLKKSPATTNAKAKYVLATDGDLIEIENIASGEAPVACNYSELSEQVGYLLALAGITAVKEIKDNPIDVKATRHLNRLYLQLLNENEDWASANRRDDMNHFMARLIFCFFAEDTDIFNGDDLFTATVAQFSERDGSNTHEVIEEIFKSMNTKINDRKAAGIKSWANNFPYVNGGLFSGNADTPKFSRIAKSYLRAAGELKWREINPDIFGSMIQAVADDKERGSLGMHYTSVPNILKVLNPLFLDDLRAKLDDVGNNARALLNLRKRMAKIRVFDPACGSGNFLVIAYKEMRAIEAEINRRRDETDLRSEIPLKNFRGIEYRSFPAEIARLALIIAEYQADVQYRGQKEALLEFLPLDAMNWIHCGNALRLDWLSIFPSTGMKVKHQANDLFHTPLDQAVIDFDNEGGETYICGNPPYIGSTWQTSEQKSDMKAVFDGRVKGWKSLDYVAGWFLKAADYGTATNAASAFVSTNSICQGQQVPILWPLIFETGAEIHFAHTSFKWANLASHNAGVTVVIVGLSNEDNHSRSIFAVGSDGALTERKTEQINAYLVAGRNIELKKSTLPISNIMAMDRGDSAIDGGGLLLETHEAELLKQENEEAYDCFVRNYIGSEELINGKSRFCLWITENGVETARKSSFIENRLNAVELMRKSSSKKQTNEQASTPHKFGEIRHRKSDYTIAVPRVSSENRDFLPVGLLKGGTIIGDRNFALYDAPLWNMALIASRLHWVWIGTVCVRLEMRFSYSNTLGWNTFPVPPLSDNNKTDLTACAEEILLAREAHFPATIADLYAPDTMPENLRRAHDKNDQTLERIYIGRRFKNDTERLEKLFNLYTKMTKTKPMKLVN